MRKITEIFAEKERTFSLEVFPPPTAEATEELYTAVEALSGLEPDYVSVTYGAGGSTRKGTRAIVNEIHRRFGLTCMHHLTLVNQTRDELEAIIREIKDDGIRNILALRGDPPRETGGQFRKVEGGLRYCYELIDLIRDVGGDYFAIGVAGYPEGHPECPSKELDTEYLKIKIDHGGQFVVTQFFFDNEVYSEYLDRTSRAGINVRIIPGVLPITDYDKLLKFASRCGAYICETIHDTFVPLRGDPKATARQGADYALRQCEDLLRRGAPGIHFYCLNRQEPVASILRELQPMRDLSATFDAAEAHTTVAGPDRPRPRALPLSNGLEPVRGFKSEFLRLASSRGEMPPSQRPLLYAFTHCPRPCHARRA